MINLGVVSLLQHPDQLEALKKVSGLAVCLWQGNFTGCTRFTGQLVHHLWMLYTS
jgi:hypothetical protein